MSVLAAIVVGAAGLAAGLLLRARLPQGAGFGLALSGLAVAIAWGCAAGAPPEGRAFTCAFALVLFAGLCLLAGLGDTAAAAASSARRLWLREVAVAAGLAALLLADGGSDAGASGQPPAGLATLLAIPALVGRVFGGPGWLLWTGLGLLLCASRSTAADAWQAIDAIAPRAIFGLGVLALAAALLPSLVHWRARRRAWLDDPAALVHPRPALTPYFAVVTLLALSAAVAGPFHLGAGGTAPGLAFAAWAAFAAGHWTGWRFAGELGLWLVALAIATIFAAAGWTSGPGLLAAGATAGLVLAWLGRSWAHLLRDGTALSTAGRLSGGALAASAGVAVALSFAVRPSLGGPSWAEWFPAVSAVVLISFWAALLMRRGPGSGSAGGSGAGLLACGLVVFALGSVAIARGRVVEPIFLGAGAVSLWVVLLLTLGRDRVCGWACQAYIWACLPVILGFAVADPEFTRQDGLAILLAVAALIGGVLGRAMWSPGAVQPR